MATSDDLVFSRGDTRQCHRVEVIVDEICELTPENFFVNMLLISGSDVFINPDLTEVLISGEQCGKLTVVSRPLLLGDAQSHSQSI